MNIYTAIIAEWKIRCSTSSFTKDRGEETQSVMYLTFSISKSLKKFF